MTFSDYQDIKPGTFLPPAASFVLWVMIHDPDRIATKSEIADSRARSLNAQAKIRNGRLETTEEVADRLEAEQFRRGRG